MPPSIVDGLKTASTHRPLPADVLAARAAQGQFSIDTLRWLHRAMAAYQAGTPLEQALGLTRPQRVRQRNAALRQAAELLGTFASEEARLRELVTAIRRFESRVRPNHRPGDRLGPVDAALARAFEAAPAGRVPATTRALRDLL